MEPQLPRAAQVRRALLAWHRAHGLRAPWRESRDPYHALVAAVMAQQTQMSRVMPSYERFIAAFPTVESLAAATRGDVIRAWAGMGYNQRAVRLHNAARSITTGGWPRDATALARIDGVGPFTAAIIASFAFGQPAACVDTNVRRVLGRLSGDETVAGARLQRLADASITATEPARWNQALMDYGAQVCTPRPKCGECVVRRHCVTYERAPAPTLKVADAAGMRYRANAGRKATQTKWEHSARYYRGRIIDVLRALPAGTAISVRDLASCLPHDGAGLTTDAVREYAEALAAHDLVVIRRGRISLPD